MRPEHESAEMSLQTSWRSHSPICQALARRTVGPGQRRFLCKAMLAEGGFELSISYSFVYFTCSLTV